MPWRRHAAVFKSYYVNCYLNKGLYYPTKFTFAIISHTPYSTQIGQLLKHFHISHTRTHTAILYFHVIWLHVSRTTLNMMFTTPLFAKFNFSIFSVVFRAATYTSRYLKPTSPHNLNRLYYFLYSILWMTFSLSSSTITESGGIMLRFHSVLSLCVNFHKLYLFCHIHSGCSSCNAKWYFRISKQYVRFRFSHTNL